MNLHNFSIVVLAMHRSSLKGQMHMTENFLSSIQYTGTPQAFWSFPGR